MPSACSQPLHFLCTELHASTGELRRRHLERRCGSRLRSRCSSCSEIYAGDARRIIASGCNGESLTWITLTAPGAEAFGRVHSASSLQGRTRRCACGIYHRPDSRVVGTPIDPSTYNYEKAAGFNAHCSRLFAVFVQKLRRLTGDSVQLVRVIEFQRRGLVHVHALLKGRVDEHTFRLAIQGGINPRTGRIIQATESGGYRFGRQCDIRPVQDAARINNYLRKLVSYAVKTAGEDLVQGAEHSFAMAKAGAKTVSCGCRLDDCQDGSRYFGSGPNKMIIAKPASHSCRRHKMARSGWGFRGHVLSASRGWGLTFTEIRQERCQYAAERMETEWVVVSFQRITGRPAPVFDQVAEPI